MGARPPHRPATYEGPGGRRRPPEWPHHCPTLSRGPGGRKRHPSSHTPGGAQSPPCRHEIFSSNRCIYITPARVTTPRTPCRPPGPLPWVKQTPPSCTNVADGREFKLPRPRNRPQPPSMRRAAGMVTGWTPPPCPNGQDGREFENRAPKPAPAPVATAGRGSAEYDGSRSVTVNQHPCLPPSHDPDPLADYPAVPIPEPTPKRTREPTPPASGPAPVDAPTARRSESIRRRR